MTDRLPGLTYDNPIWHGKWRIYRSDPMAPDSMAWTYVHDDYDGAPDANDYRFGYAESIEAAKADVDEIEDGDAP